MEIKCRCHGLSGSCSLKTCWLKLPDFQQIGAYLKRKYESSIHLPSVVNINKLIPMMDRNEISAILSNQHQQHQPQQRALADQHQEPASPMAPVQQQPEFAPLLGAPPPAATSNHPTNGRPALLELTTPANVPAHFNYYERHKQLEQMANLQRVANLSTISPNSSAATATAPFAGSHAHSSDDIPVNIVPMTQQQYQALLKEMKLCNTIGPQQQTATTSYLTTRDLQQHHHKQQSHQANEASSQQVAAATNGPSGNKHLHKKLQQTGNNGLANLANLANHNIRNANQHLSQLLHSNNKDDLVHLHKSPDYCEADPRHGFAGVQARVCSDNPLAPDSCDKLCCGRGYEARESQLRYSCDCKFQYCCKIHCNFCYKKIVELVCK